MVLLIDKMFGILNFKRTSFGHISEVTPEYGKKSKAFVFTASPEDDDEDAQDDVDTDWGETLLTGREGMLESCLCGAGGIFSMSGG